MFIRQQIKCAVLVKRTKAFFQKNKKKKNKSIQKEIPKYREHIPNVHMGGWYNNQI